MHKVSQISRFLKRPISPVNGYKKLANGTRASFTYDAGNQLTKLYNLKSGASVISSFDYQYNEVSNRTNVVESEVPPFLVPGVMRVWVG